MFVTRAAQLNQTKKGNTDEDKTDSRKHYSFLTFSAMLMAAQMQMPASTDGTKKPAEAPAVPKTLTGTVSDSMCGAHHMAKDKSPAECTRVCVKQGTKHALVAGKKVYTLAGHEAELDKLAGMKATVKGSVSGETMTVLSVAPTMKTELTK